MARIDLPGVLLQLEDPGGKDRSARVLVQSENPGGKDRSARCTGAVRSPWWQG